MSGIHFFKEGVSFRLSGRVSLEKWIASVLRHYKLRPANVNFIFCRDRYLLNLNRAYLKHNYFTDVITFDHSAGDGNAASDIYISVDRIKVNAKKYEVTFNDELHRAMVHGILHLAGFRDKKPSEVKKMKAAEEYWLAKR